MGLWRKRITAGTLGGPQIDKGWNGEMVCVGEKLLEEKKYGSKRNKERRRVK